jgi:hypothetical protein
MKTVEGLDSGACSVLWPLGKRHRDEIEFASRVTDLNGLTVVELQNMEWGTWFSFIRPELQRRYPDLTVIPGEVFGFTHGPDEAEVIANLPAKLAEYKVDAVISGIGLCGSCTPAALRASLTAERAGVPSVTIVETGFLRLAEMVSQAFGVKLPIAEYPGQVSTDSENDFAAKLVTDVTDAVVAGLASEVVVEHNDAEDFGPAGPVVRDSWSEMQDYFYRSGWTDGLPIISPTTELVDEFLRYTERDRDEVLSILIPSHREATIQNIAINGIMAGCRPEYMPILISIVECISDPEYLIKDAGSTPGWEPLVMINGPIVEQLRFNFETGAMRPGPLPNTSIGRFLSLYMRNVAGLVPGTTSNGALGSNFNVVLAESSASCRALGWKPMSSDTRGFLDDDNVVTVRSVVSVTSPNYSAGESAEEHLALMTEFIGASTSALWSMRIGLMMGKWSSLFVVTPMIAKVLARDGYTKRDVANYLYENCTMPASVIERYEASRVGPNSKPWSLKEEVVSGVLGKEYYASDDPDRPIRVNLRPEWIDIVVAGSPGVAQARGYMGNHRQGFPTSRSIQLPDSWPGGRATA